MKKNANRKKKIRTTRKIKTIYHGERLVNPETGEEIEAARVIVEDRDANFAKFWVQEVLLAIDEFGTSPLKVLMYIFCEAIKSPENLVIASARDIAKQIDMSDKTVYRVLSILQEHDIIRREKPGVIRVNPDIIFKGTAKRRQNVLLTWEAAKQKNGKNGKQKNGS
jgi:DNA-binding transcriptional ArsR family regulator